MCVYVGGGCVCTCVCTVVMKVLWVPEDSGRHFETVVTGGHELSNVVSGY